MPENIYRCRKAYPWFSILMLAFSAMLLLSACGGGASAATPPTPAAATPTVATPLPTPTPAAPALTKGSQLVVTITDGSNGSFGFSPQALTVAVGTTITWKNNSSAPHTVTSDDGQTFDSGSVPMAAGGTFSFKFTTAGTFTYHCNIHPYMKGTIFVQQA